MSTDTKLLSHITLEATFKYGSKIWILNQKDSQQLEETQIRFYITTRLH